MSIICRRKLGNMQRRRERLRRRSLAGVRLPAAGPGPPPAAAGADPGHCGQGRVTAGARAGVRSIASAPGPGSGEDAGTDSDFEAAESHSRCVLASAGLWFEPQPRRLAKRRARLRPAGGLAGAGSASPTGPAPVGCSLPCRARTRLRPTCADHTQTHIQRGRDKRWSERERRWPPTDDSSSRIHKHTHLVNNHTV